MYSYRYHPQFLFKINHLARPKLLASVWKKIESLEKNPYNKARPTGKPILGEWYVNAGNYYAVTFDVDEENKVIEVLKVLARSHLYKLLS